ncbi:site-2 protease family protein [archaeon]|nr:site-2 protease family protein [archaeon]
MRFTFSRREIKDIAKAWLVLSFAFAILMSGGLGHIAKLMGNALIAFASVGLGFLLHELGHKLVAQYYGCLAEFRAHNFMLALGVLTSFFGIIFAVPGAVYISGHTGINRAGKIALAGPFVNIALALAFLFLAFFPVAEEFAKFGFMINAWFAVFNLLPFFFFDGHKIFRWNKKVYFAMLIIALLLFLFL